MSKLEAGRSRLSLPIILTRSASSISWSANSADVNNIEIPLVFVEVNSIAATPESPKNAKFYSDKNSVAANPDADKITDPKWRKSFLENVEENRAILEMWERMHR